jgi:hypothetical protein
VLVPREGFNKYNIDVNKITTTVKLLRIPYLIFKIKFLNTTLKTNCKIIEIMINDRYAWKLKNLLGIIDESVR